MLDHYRANPVGNVKKCTTCCERLDVIDWVCYYFEIRLMLEGEFVKLEDIKLKLTDEEIDENTWNVEEWRKKYPMDYFKALSILSQSDNAIVTTEVFKTLYRITRMHVPDILYKYYSLADNEILNQKKLKILGEEKIFMSEISGFNDPFDGKAFFYHPEQLMDIQRLKAHGGKLIDDFTSFIRGTCFTSNGAQSMPMWGNYSNNHKGFCVSYDVKSNMELSNGVFPIQYTDERLDVTSLLRKQAEMICNSIDVNIHNGNKVTMYDDLMIIYMALLMYNVKHSSWSYENEYRCTTASNAVGMPFINAKPKEIFVGMKCEVVHIKALRDIAYSLDIPIYQMKLDEEMDKYELMAQEILAV